jgi:hypothetical protein
VAERAHVPLALGWGGPRDVRTVQLPAVVRAWDARQYGAALSLQEQPEDEARAPGKRSRAAQQPPPSEDVRGWPKRTGRECFAPGGNEPLARGPGQFFVRASRQFRPVSDEHLDRRDRRRN